MSSRVVNKLTFEIVANPNTPDYPSTEWLHDPSGLDTLVDAGVPKRHWKVTSEDLQEMSASEIGALAPNESEIAGKKEEINNSYLYEAYLPVQVDDRWYTADQMTQHNLTAMIAMEDSTLYPYSDTVGGDRTWSLHTHDDLIVVAKAIRDRNLALYIKAESLKYSIKSVTTMQELNSITWED